MRAKERRTLSPRKDPRSRFDHPAMNAWCKCPDLYHDIGARLESEVGLRGTKLQSLTFEEHGGETRPVVQWV